MSVYVKTKDGKLKPIREDVTAEEIKNALGYAPADADDIVITAESIEAALGYKPADANAVPDVDLSEVEDSDDVFYVTDENGYVIFRIDKDGIHTTTVNAKEALLTDVNLGEKETTEWSLKKHLEDSKLEKPSATEHTVHVTPDDRLRWDSNTSASDESVTQLTNNFNAHVVDNKRHKTAAEQAAIDASDDGKTFVIVDKDGYKIAEFDAAGLHVLNVLIGNNAAGEEQKSIAQLIEEAMPSLDGYAKTSDLEDLATTADVNTKVDGLNDRIDTVEDIAKGANRAKVFRTYDDLITHLNSIDDSVYGIGQNFYIAVLDVPDLWVASVTDGSLGTYPGNADDLLNDLKSGIVTVNCYGLSVLETQKAVLTDYVKKTEQATALANLKEEIGEEVASDQEEFHIVDANYNIVATIDENGLHTVKVIADKVFSEGSKCINEERLRELNYVSATDVIEYVGNEVTKLTNGTTVVGKASTANSLTEGYVEYTASAGKITLTTPIDKAVLICARGEAASTALEAMVVLTGYSTPSHSGYYCVRSAAPSSLNVVTFYNSSGATFTPYTVRVREL